MGRRVNGESEFGFLSVVDGESFQKKGSESGSCSSSDGVEDHESLESGTVVRQFSDSVQTEVDDFLSDGVMSSGEVVGGVFFSRDQLFRVEELSVGSGSDFVNDGGFQVEED